MKHVSPPRALAALVFLQMLPATLVAPAIRPLFARWHAGDQGAMHAFMSVNMIGAALAAPILGALLDRRAGRARLLAVLAVSDALLLAACSTPAPVGLILALRTLEGAAHVGAVTLLMAEAVALGADRGDGPPVALAGAAIMLAVAAGSVIGAALIPLDPRAPFWLAAVLAAAVAVYGPRRIASAPRTVRPRLAELRALARELAGPATAAFAGRFTIGCIVVTFSLYAHEVHHLDDASVGALFAALTVPFALATYPATRLAAQIPRAALLAVGVAVYAVGLALLPFAPTAALAPILIVAGLASALIFAATLGYAAETGGATRASAMALFNAAGCLGMVLGPMVAGITIAVVRARVDAATGYRAAFGVAASALVIWLVAAAPWLRRRLIAERQAGQATPRTAGAR